MLVVVAIVSAMAATAVPEAEATSREWLDIDIFAEVPEPGHPEGLVVEDDDTVYVGTHQHISELPDGPSRIFQYDGSGVLQREFVIEGQDPTQGAGLVGMVLDANGVIYALDRHPQRIVALDPDTGEQWTYATFQQIRELCIPGALTLVTMCGTADGLTFGPDGMLYVTDVTQGLIWRVPPGGGPAEVWFRDTRLDSVFGPNGIEMMPDGRTLLFAQSITGPTQTFLDLLGGDPSIAATSRLYTLPILPNGSPGNLEVFWESSPGDAIDGFALAESGNVYAALALANAVAVISPAGEEVAKAPETPVHNQLLDVPMDDPASVDFLGDRVLVTNHSLVTGNPDSFVVYDVFAGEPGAKPFRPAVPSG